MRSFRVEGSLNILPILGSTLKKDENDLYEKSSYGEFNLIKAITEGFPEPYAISFFMGEKVFWEMKTKGLQGLD